MSRLIEDYLRNLFEEKKVPENQREQLWRYYYDKLSKGVDEGFSPQSSHYDKDLADALKLSIAEFSAFKETSFRKTIEDLLVDENGSLGVSSKKKLTKSLVITIIVGWKPNIIKPLLMHKWQKNGKGLRLMQTYSLT